MGILSRWSGGSRERAGRAWDPVFIFMVIAMALAVISSIALRTVVSGMGPSAAHASDGTFDLDNLPKPGPVRAHPSADK